MTISQIAHRINGDTQVVQAVLDGIGQGHASHPIGTRHAQRSADRVADHRDLPAQIGQGMTAFTATDAVTRHEQALVQNLLSTTGKTLYVEKEDLLDAVTAVSGSGPAYVYYFMDAMVNTAMQMGFNKSEAELLVMQTFSGAMSLYQQSELNCKEWIEKVASKGGTTEAALRSFSENKIDERIGAGVQKASRGGRPGCGAADGCAQPDL